MALGPLPALPRVRGGPPENGGGGGGPPPRLPPRSAPDLAALPGRAVRALRCVGWGFERRADWASAHKIAGRAPAMGQGPR